MKNELYSGDLSTFYAHHFTMEGDTIGKVVKKYII